MKKNTRFVAAIALSLCIVLMSVSTVFASTTTDEEWTDPTVQGKTSDTVYAYDVLTEAEIPGSINNDATMIIPSGFDGMKQFGGSGIKIFDLATSADTVSITFAFPTYQYGWTGGIYKWDGSEWVAVKSTLVAPTGENSLYHVTASKVGNGIYALLVNYTGSAE